MRATLTHRENFVPLRVPVVLPHLIVHQQPLGFSLFKLERLPHLFGLLLDQIIPQDSPSRGEVDTAAFLALEFFDRTPCRRLPPPAGFDYIL